MTEVSWDASSVSISFNSGWMASNHMWKKKTNEQKEPQQNRKGVSFQVMNLCIIC